VTGEIYTLGFDGMVLNVLPNMTVENSGNHSVPPPVRRPTLWELMWNSFTGLVSAVWNAVVAVAQFVANVVAAVVKWGIGLAMAIASGQGLQYIYDTVVKPFVDALLAFIRWIMDMIVAFINLILEPIFAPIVTAFNRWAMDLGALTLSAASISGTFLAERLADLIFLSPLFFFLTGLIIAFSVAEKVFLGMTLGLGSLASFAVSALAGVIIGFLTIELISKITGDGALDGMVPDWFDDEVDWSFGLLEFYFVYWLIAAKKSRSSGLPSVLVVENALRDSIICLLLLFATTVISASLGGSVPAIATIVLLDSIALYFGLKASVIIKSGTIRQWYPLLYPLSLILYTVSLASSIIGLIADISDLANAVGKE
jgi:hypothetical protein